MSSASNYPNVNWRFWAIAALFFAYVAATFFLYENKPEGERDPHVVSILVFISAHLGSLGLYLWQNREGQKIWIHKDRLKKWLNLKRMNDAHHRLMEMVLFVLIGAFFALCFIKPSTPMQAFAAGLGWIGVASTFMSSKPTPTGGDA